MFKELVEESSLQTNRISTVWGKKTTQKKRENSGHPVPCSFVQWNKKKKQKSELSQTQHTNKQSTRYVYQGLKTKKKGSRIVNYQMG